DTVGDLATAYLERYAQVKKRSWKDDARMLRAEVLPSWRHRKARDIHRRDVRELLEEIARAGHRVLPNRVQSVLSKMFNFAMDVEIVDVNPVTGLGRVVDEHARDRVLTEDEIAELWRTCDAQPRVVAAFWKLRLLTAQRGGEVVAMRWADVDLVAGWWTIPGA